MADNSNNLGRNHPVILALLSGFFGAALTAVVTVGAPIASTHFEENSLKDSFLTGVASADFKDVLLAMNSTSPDSPADLYLKSLEYQLRASTINTDPAADSGEMDGSRDGDSVCLAKHPAVGGKCFEFSEFRYNAENKLIESFAINGIPVDELVKGAACCSDATNRAQIDPRDPGTSDDDVPALFKAYRYAVITDPEQDYASFVMNIVARPRNGTGIHIQVSDFRDRNNDANVEHIEAGSTWIGPYAESLFVVRMASPTGGYAHICAAYGDSDQSWAQVESNKQCNWVLLS